MAQYEKAELALKLVPKLDEVVAGDMDPDALMTEMYEFMNGELLGYYVVPFPTTGAGVNEQADEPNVRQVARYLGAGIMLHHRHIEDAAGAMPSNFWWNKGMSMLNRIIAGTRKLDPAHATLDTTGTYTERRIKAKRTGYPPTFNKGNELGWKKPVIDLEGDRDQLDPDEYKAPY